MPKPQPHLSLRAEMVLRGVTMRTISDKTRIPYTFVSELLSGSRVDPVRLSMISGFIFKHKRLAEVAS